LRAASARALGGGAAGPGWDGDSLWPEDKGPWLDRLMATLEVARDEGAPVGDSQRDASLLRASGHAFYVGTALPSDLPGIHHHPDGDLEVVARAILRC
jgi:phosphoserine phosphatase